MPHDTFRWIGVDGSEVLTHFMSTPTFGDDGGYTYNGLIDPASVKGVWDLYHDKEINKDLLLAYGNGDGGGGVNRDMLEMGRHLKAMPGLPEVIPGTAYDYFENLQKTIASTDRHVPTWDGELYLEYHRGTYTSQARNKKNNRKTELKLREAEWLVSEAAVKTGDFLPIRKKSSRKPGRSHSETSSMISFLVHPSMRYTRIPQQSMQKPMKSWIRSRKMP